MTVKEQEYPIYRFCETIPGSLLAEEVGVSGDTSPPVWAFME